MRSCPRSSLVPRPRPTQAHRGTGNYAYVNVIREVAAATPHFRVLALSATPGSDIKASGNSSPSACALLLTSFADEVACTPWGHRGSGLLFRGRYRVSEVWWGKHVKVV